MAPSASDNWDREDTDGRDPAEESSLESAVDDGADPEDGILDEDDGPSDAEVTEEEKQDPTTDDVSFEVGGSDEAPEDDGIAPGAEGRYGSGIEGADQILEEERVRADGTQGQEWGDFEDQDGQDDSAAAEQGNRDEDEMVSEGDDAREVAELGGDDWDVDAVSESDEPADEDRLAQGLDIDGAAADLTGDVDGEDPLAGGPTGR